MFSSEHNFYVAIVFFNRPNALRQVFESVRKAKPTKLFLIQDGPRGNKDIQGIDSCRRIVDNIDWDCEVFRNYSDENLGCGKRMSTGISWVFEHVDKAIILEDDCVPSQQFYLFCEEMLNAYEFDERILMISGMNHWGAINNSEDYLFALNGAIWGWATWKRAWEKFDYSVSAIENTSVVDFILHSGVEPYRIARMDVNRWIETNRKVKSNEKISYWAHQWRLVKIINHNLCIVPRCNLVSNVGDQDATHPTGGNSKCEYHHLKINELTFPLKHPEHVYQNYKYDSMYYENFYPTLLQRILKRFKRIFSRE